MSDIIYNKEIYNCFIFKTTVTPMINIDEMKRVYNKISHYNYILVGLPVSRLSHTKRKPKGSVNILLLRRHRAKVECTSMHASMFSDDRQCDRGEVCIGLGLGRRQEGWGRIGEKARADQMQ